MDPSKRAKTPAVVDQVALEKGALEQLRRGDLRGAFGTLTILLRHRPNDGALQRRIQQVEALIRQREDAQHRIQAEPLRYAHAYIQAGRLAEGLQLLRAALSRDPNNARLRELALEVARRLRTQVQKRQSTTPSGTPRGATPSGGLPTLTPPVAPRSSSVSVAPPTAAPAPSSGPPSRGLAIPSPTPVGPPSEPTMPRADPVAPAVSSNWAAQSTPASDPGRFSETQSASPVGSLMDSRPPSVAPVSSPPPVAPPAPPVAPPAPVPQAPMSVSPAPSDTASGPVVRLENLLTRIRARRRAS